MRKIYVSLVFELFHPTKGDIEMFVLKKATFRKLGVIEQEIKMAIFRRTF